MGELTIRADRRIASVRGQGTAKGQKTAGTAGQTAVRTAFTASETLEQLTRADSRAVRQAREALRALQSGEGALSELRDSLERLGELARRAAGGGETGREALQAEAEQILKDVERILNAGISLFPESGGETMSGDRLAVLLLGALIAGGGTPPEEISPERALEGLRLLLEKAAEGVEPDRAVSLLTKGKFTGLADFQAWFSGGDIPELTLLLDGLFSPDGLSPALPGLSTLPDLSALLPLLELGGTDRGLMAQVLTALESVRSGRESVRDGRESARDGRESARDGRESVRSGQEHVRTAPEGAQAGGGARSAPGSLPVTRAGGFEAAGKDLSGLSLRAADGRLTVGGRQDVTLRGTEQRGGGIAVTGSGTVTLREVRAASLTANAPAARIFAAGETELGELRLEQGTVLTVDGSGPLRVGAFHAEAGSLLRLAEGAAVMPERGEEELAVLTAPVVLEGPASLAAAARAGVHTPDGRALDPFDVVWESLLPGWSGITSVAVDGRQARMAFLRGDPVRLWLSRGEHGHEVHDLVLQGRDETGRPRTRYAYLLWNQKRGTFEEVSLGTNPFSVTGGEPGQDWIYEEENRTLRVLSGRVTAISGGDGGQAPPGGRIALADGIGAVRLTLEGVVCRTAAGSAFDLGRENDVTLLLQDGTDSRFESGPGRAGISLGAGACLRLDRAAPGEGGRGADGALTAIGGRGGAGIGRDGGESRDRTSRILILGGAVTASGGASAAGIGAGRHSAIGSITITGGTVAAAGGTGGGAGIGGALDAPAGDIRISGGRIAAEAAGHAAAIGSGVQGPCGDILICGTARIVKAADIGACPLGGCGSVTVSGGADIGAARLRTQADIPEARDGETSPQFLLSMEDLGLDRLRVQTREEALRAVPEVDKALRRLAALRRIYGELYARAQRGDGRGLWPPSGAVVRDTGAAGALLDDLKRAAPQALRAHGRPEDAGQLLCRDGQG